MKIVMTYWIGDDISWCTEITKGIEYESTEAALVDFDALLRAKKLNPGQWPHHFDFAGRRFDASDFRIGELPDFYSVDEWFALEAKCQNV